MEKPLEASEKPSYIDGSNEGINTV